MNLTDYKEIVNLTAVYPQTVHDFGKVYTWLGLEGEFEEFLTSFGEAQFKERFDVIWYAAAFCKEFDLDFERIFNDARNQTGVYKFYGVWYETLKKYYRDGKAIPKSAAEAQVYYPIYNVLKGLTDEEIERGLKMNYDKLIKRRETNTIHGDGDDRENH
jgi:hypothetical protein